VDRGRKIFDPQPHDEPEGARSSLVTHNVYIDGNRTSVRLEPIIWDTLQGIARQEGITVHDLVSRIDRQKTAGNLSSAIRAFVVTYLLTKLPEDMPFPVG